MKPQWPDLKKERNMSVPTNREFCFWYCSTYIFCLKIPTAGCDFVVVFIGSYSKMYCSELALPLLYISEYILGLGFMYMLFHDVIFFYSLTATQNLTFVYIKWTPYVAFTGSFLDIVWNTDQAQYKGNCQIRQHKGFILYNQSWGFGWRLNIKKNMLWKNLYNLNPKKLFRNV